MGDTELVSRAQHAAARLESAWESWRTRHGLGGALAQPVASYVGYAPEDPRGRPRVVFGVDAAEAEQLALLLDGLTRSASGIAEELCFSCEDDPATDQDNWDATQAPCRPATDDLPAALPDAARMEPPLVAAPTTAPPTPAAAPAAESDRGEAPAAGGRDDHQAPDWPSESVDESAEARPANPGRPAKAKARKFLSRPKVGIRPAVQGGAAGPAAGNDDQASDVPAESEAEPHVTGDEPAGSGGPTPAVARPDGPARPATEPEQQDAPGTAAPSIAAELASWAASELPGQASAGLAALMRAERTPAAQNEADLARADDQPRAEQTEAAPMRTEKPRAEQTEAAPMRTEKPRAEQAEAAPMWTEKPRAEQAEAGHGGTPAEPGSGNGAGVPPRPREPADIEHEGRTRP